MVEWWNPASVEDDACSLDGFAWFVEGWDMFLYLLISFVEIRGLTFDDRFFSKGTEVGAALWDHSQVAWGSWFHWISSKGVTITSRMTMYNEHITNQVARIRISLTPWFSPGPAKKVDNKSSWQGLGVSCYTSNMCCNMSRMVFWLRGPYVCKHSELLLVVKRYLTTVNQRHALLTVPLLTIHFATLKPPPPPRLKSRKGRRALLELRNPRVSSRDRTTPVRVLLWCCSGCGCGLATSVN